MGWTSGRKPVYRLNTTHLNKRQQEDFLRDYLKMDTKKLQKLKKQLNGSRLLQGGKTVTQSEFTKTLEGFHRGAKLKFKSYLRDMKKKYEDYQAEIKAANIKKTREMDMKREVADEKVRKLVGLKGDGGRMTSIYDRIKKKKQKSLSKEERREQAKLERKFKKRLEITNVDKTSWQHAETSKVAGISSVIPTSRPQPPEHTQLQSVPDKTSVSLKQTEEESVDIAELKEKAKNLPDLQI